MGGTGDLMETKVKENKSFRESGGRPERPGRLEAVLEGVWGLIPILHLVLFFFSSSSSFFLLAWFHHVIQDAMERSPSCLFRDTGYFLVTV